MYYLSYGKRNIKKVNNKDWRLQLNVDSFEQIKIICRLNSFE